MGLVINNQQDPRPPSNTDTSNSRWETVGEIGGGLMFTACNLLSLSNWLSPPQEWAPTTSSNSHSNSAMRSTSAASRLIFMRWIPYTGPNIPSYWSLVIKVYRKGGSSTKREWFSELSTRFRRATSSSPHRRVVMKMKLGSRWCWGVEVMGSRVEEELDVSVE